LYNTFRPDLKQQTIRGKLQFQSEGAELYYRNIEIRPIIFKQSAPKLVAGQPIMTVTSGQRQYIEIVNQGDAVEIIAAELIGKQIENIMVKLPPLPLTLKKGGKLSLPVTLKEGAAAGNKTKFRLETVLGPVPDFSVELETK
jgi:hypothetical protein